jgi:hypothetical protein
MPNRAGTDVLRILIAHFIMTLMCLTTLDKEDFIIYNTNNLAKGIVLI